MKKINFIKALKNKIAKPWQWVGHAGFQDYSVNYDAWINEAYRNPFVHAALKEIITDFNAIDIGIYRKKRNGEIEKIKNHKVMEWLENPNMELTRLQWQEYYLTWKILNGGLLLNKSKGITKKNLYIYAPNTFEVKRDQNTLQINGLKIGDTSIVGNDMKYYKVVKGINISDTIAGYSTEFQSQIAACAIPGDMTNYALKHQTAQLKNSGKRNGIFSYSGFKNKQQKEEAEQKLKSMTTGDNTGKTAMIPGDSYKFIDMSQTTQELDWLNGMKYMAEVIASVMGVPIQLISSAGTTYNNVEEFKGKIYKDRIIPEMKEYCQTMTAFLKEDLGDAFIWFDVSEIDELQPDVLDIAKKLGEALAGKVTLNTYYRLLQEKTGLQIDPLPKELGDKVLTNQSNIFLDDLNFEGEVPSGEKESDI